VATGLAAAGPASAGQTSSVTISAHAKKKKKKCKKGQVRVTVNKHKRCRKLGAALPPPRAGDGRLVLVGFALGDSGLGRLRDRHHRRPPSLKKVFRRVNPHAWNAIQSAIRRGLGRLDQMAAASPAFSQRPFAGYGPGLLGRRNPNCADPNLPTQSESFNSSGGGGKLTATMSLGHEAVLGLGLESGDYKIQLTFSDNGGCNGFDAPECPTADGVVDATDRTRSIFALSVAKNGVVIASKDMRYEGDTRMHAQVGEDAKLDFIDIDDSQRANLEVGDAKQNFGPVNVLWTALHRTRVKMPSRSYDPGHSAVDIAVSAGGVTVGKNALGQTATDIANDLDKAFAALVDKEIKNFQNLETGWNTPNRCVGMTFNPASGAHPLHRPDSGKFTAQLKLQPSDGDPRSGDPSGNWTLSDKREASFSPASGKGNTFDVNYSVPSGSNPGTAGVSLKAVGKAGVAAGPWAQTIQGGPVSPKYVAELHGSETIDTTEGCHYRWEVSYDGSFSESTSPDGGFYLPGFPGQPETGARASEESGSGTVTQDPCEDNDDPGCSGGMQRYSHSDPGHIVFDLKNDNDIRVRANGFDFEPTGDCGGDPLIELGIFGEGTISRSEVGDQTITVQVAQDLTTSGEHAVGQGTVVLHRVN
jgi:hypothetical protein